MAVAAVLKSKVNDVNVKSDRIRVRARYGESSRETPGGDSEVVNSGIGMEWIKR